MTAPRLLPLLLVLALTPGCVIVSDDDLAAQKDQDGDGVPFTSDCDDDDAEVGEEREWSVDQDGDGFAGAELVVSCRRPSGATEQLGDCDDANPLAFPGAPDAPYDGVDADCAGADLNGDGVDDDWDVDGDGEAAAPEGPDCDDAEAAVNTAAVEVCDGVDNDCDGDLDVDDADLDPSAYLVAYPDGDGDGFGVEELGEAACALPEGYSEQAGDCDDDLADVNPDAAELCNLGIDDDCDGLVDARDPDVDITSAPSWYEDRDRDGYGVGDSLGVFCEAPSVGTAPADGDCDDGLPGVNPAAVEICDETDNNCNGALDDADPSLDLSTRNTFYEDADNDGFGDPGRTDVACLAPPGFVGAAGDCADADPARNPAATEVCNGAVDDDCDGLADDADSSLLRTSRSRFYLDGDSDGWGLAGTDLDACAAPVGYVTAVGDCDDAEALANPGLAEVCEDGLDNDCDGTTAPCSRGVRTMATTASAHYTSTRLGALGSSIAALSDADGDGADEVWLGSPGADGGDGAALLLTGGTPSGDAWTLSSRTVVYGAGTEGRTGCSIATGGDFDGNGVEDVAIGTCSRSASWAVEGSAYLTDGTGTGYVFLVEGGSTNRQAGSSLHLVPDLNGDGKDELLIGGPTNATGANQGVVWLISGGQSGTATAGAVSFASWLGETTGDKLGNVEGAHGLSSVDFDGDGLHDLLIGASAAGGLADPGRVYMVDGGLMLAGASGSSSAGSADLVMRGVSTTPGFGATVRGLGDLNADGYGDFAVGAADSSQAVVVLGLSRIPGTLTAAGADLRLSGASGLGADIAAEDFDGDGVIDVAVSAPDQPVSGVGLGVAYIAFGPLPRGTVDVTTAVTQLIGPTGERLGATMALADVDADGDRDLVLSGLGADGRTGAAWIWEAVGY